MGSVAGGLLIFYVCKYAKMRRLAEIVRKANLQEENSRREMERELSTVEFMPHLDALKLSLDGSLITPKETAEYMEARRRPFNQDMRGKESRFFEFNFGKLNRVIYLGATNRLSPRYCASKEHG